MNLQEALNLALTSTSENESIIHVGKVAQHKYELFIVTYNDEEKWFVIYYQSTSLLPYDCTMEQDTYCGDNLEQLLADIHKDIDVTALKFHQYSVAPSQLFDYDMPYVFNTIFPDSIPEPELVTDSSHYQRLVDKHLATL
jgi:hypothetical protein